MTRPKSRWAHAQAPLDVCAGKVDYTRTALPIGEGHALVDEIPFLHLVIVELASNGEARGSVRWSGSGPR